MNPDGPVPLWSRAIFLIVDLNQNRLAKKTDACQKAIGLHSAPENSGIVFRGINISLPWSS